MRFNADEIRKAVDVIHGGELYEVRYVIGKKVYSGYFKGTAGLISELERLPENGGNVYITLQSIDNECYNREQHEILRLSPKVTTNDDNITDYNYLLIDFDPVRPSGVGSTNEQLQAARDRAAQVYKYLETLEFAPPLAAMSGNGFHLIYKISLRNTPENVKLISDCLKALDMMFSTNAVNIDTGVFNPSRVSKLYGTFACKGADTPETPYRIAHIVNVPINFTEDVTLQIKLETLAAYAPVKPQPATTVRSGGAFDLQAWLSEHNVPIRETQFCGGTTKYILQCCPFDSSHGNKDAAVFQLSDGSYGFKCFHNSCSDKHWKEFREFYEPDAYAQKFAEPDTSLKPNHTTAGYAEAVNSKWDKIMQLGDTAQPDEPKFYTLSDVLAMPQKPEEYISTGIHELDKSLGGLKKGLVTCVSGLRGSGKSSLLSQMVIHASVKEGARVLMFSGELTARTAADWIFRQAAGNCGVQKMEKFSTKYFVPDACKKIIADGIADKFYIYNNSFGNDYRTVLGEMCKIQEDKQVDLILLDNLMSLDIRSADADKYQAQSRFIEQLEMFAKEANVHIIFVAHPRKAQGFLRLDDISGSGDIANRVDNAIIVHRRNADFKRLTQRDFCWKADHDMYAEGVDNVLEVCKDRENGTQDKFIGLSFDARCKRFDNVEIVPKTNEDGEKVFENGREVKAAKPLLQEQYFSFEPF